MIPFVAAAVTNVWQRPTLAVRACSVPACQSITAALRPLVAKENPSAQMRQPATDRDLHRAANFLVGPILLAGMVLAAGAAQAQAPSVSQPPVPRQETDERTPAARAAESYDPQGVRVGSFVLHPQIELDEIVNDNIYATSSGRTASFIQLIRPSLELRSDWNKHMLNLYARGGFAFYGADAGQNYQDFSIGADGRLDIMREWNTYGGLSFNRRHEELGTPNTVTGQFQPTIYDQLSANVGYYQRFGPIKARLDSRLDNFSYFNNDTGPAQGVIPNSDRNRIEFRESLRLGYEFIPGYEVWVRGGLNQRSYKNVPDSSGLYRNSTGWDVVGGVTLDLGGITFLEAFAGYVQQDYVDIAFKPVRAPMFGLIGHWNPMRELWVRPFVRRTVDDSSLSTASSYLSTSAGIDVNYNLRPNIRIDVHGDYSIADYQAISSANPRYDQYYTFRAGVMYLPTPNFFVGPTYQFVHRTSNQVNSSYDQNVIMLRLGARL